MKMKIHTQGGAQTFLPIKHNIYLQNMVKEVMLNIYFYLKMNFIVYQRAFLTSVTSRMQLVPYLKYIVVKLMAVLAEGSKCSRVTPEGSKSHYFLLADFLLIRGGLTSFWQSQCGKTAGNFDMAIGSLDSPWIVEHNGIKISFLVILSLTSFCQITAVWVMSLLEVKFRLSVSCELASWCVAGTRVHTH